MQNNLTVFQQTQMIKPKEQVIEQISQIDQNWKQAFQNILQPYCSEFLHIDSNEQIFQILGAWLYQIIKSSKHDDIRQKYQRYIQMPPSSELITLAEEIFKLNKGQGFPSTQHFEQVGKDLKESFEYEKHREGNISAYLRMINGEKTQFKYSNIPYRIAILISNNLGVFMVFSKQEQQQRFQPALNAQPKFPTPNYFDSQLKFQIQSQENTTQQSFQQTKPIQQQFKPQQFLPSQQFSGLAQNAPARQMNTNFSFNPNQFQQINAQNQFITSTNITEDEQDLSNYKMQRSHTCDFQNNTQHKKTPSQQLIQNNNQQSHVISNYQPVQFIPIQQGNSLQQGRFATPNISQHQVPQYLPPRQFQTNAQQFQPNMQYQQQPPLPPSPPIQQLENTGSIPFEQWQPDQNDQETDVLSTAKLNEKNKPQPEQKLTSQEIIQFPSYLKASSNRLTCIVCTLVFDPNKEGILTPCCSKKVHKECCINDLISKANMFERFDKITCYTCQQTLEKENEVQFLKSHIPFELMFRLIRSYLLKNAPLKCFNCQTLIEISQNMKDVQHEYQCTQCKAKICTLCREKFHGQNQKNQQCPGVRAEILKAMADKPITICPFCDLIQTKDDRCNHVTCSSCNNNLCSVCSVDREPILAHGNHYHRKGCSDYQQWIDQKTKKVITKEEIDMKKCKRCKQNNVACKYPISLEEYKKLKNY